MNNIENILNYILDEAKSIAENKINLAKQESSNKIKEANELLEKENAKFITNVEAECNRIVENAVLSANLTVNKQTLKFKHEVFDAVFSKVLDNLNNLDEEKYQKLIEKLLIKYAQENDEIIMAKNCKVNEDFIKSLDVFKTKNLKLSSNREDINGGFILSNEICNTIVSFESLVNEFKEKYSTAIYSLCE